MEEKMCPEIIALDLIEGYIGNDERYVYQYPIIMRYLKNKIANRKITDYLAQIGCNRVVLYAVTEFTDLLISDISNESSQMIWSVCDKKADEFGGVYKGCTMLNVESMISDYKDKKFDKIIVCNIFHANDIVTELVENGISMDDIVKVIEAIYWM